MGQAFLDRWIDRFDSIYEIESLATISWFTAAPGIKTVEAVVDGLVRRGDHVVDLGCGPGCDAVFLATAGAQVTAVDSSAAALDRGRALADWAGVAVSFVHGDILATGLPDASADVVNDSFVFHNIRDEARADYADEVHRLLRPRGTFLLSAFSDRMVEGSGPRRITSTEVLDTFRPDRFERRHLEIYRNLPTQERPDQLHWFGVFRKVSS